MVCDQLDLSVGFDVFIMKLAAKLLDPLRVKKSRKKGKSMNQQSGMEADKEIDRFLQKVKNVICVRNRFYCWECMHWLEAFLAFGTVRGDLVSVL